MKNLIAFITVLTFAACSGSDVTEETIPIIVEQVRVQDLADNGNASDLLVSFSKAENEEEVEEYRIIVISGSMHMTIEQASALDKALYLRVAPRGGQINVTLPETFIDSEGQQLKENVTYSLIVLAVASSNSNLSENGLSNAVQFTFGRVNQVKTVAQGFSASGGIVLAPSGDVYIADFGTGETNGTKIIRVSADRSAIVDFADGLLGPTGGTFDAQGNLYWSSYSGNMVHRIDASGNVSDFASVAGPVAIEVDGKGNLIVASCDNNRIMRIEASGNVSTYASSSLFNCPNGLSFDDVGNLFVSNFEEGSIMKVMPNGTVEAFANIPSKSSVNMVYHNNNLFITGRKAHVIYKVSTVDASIELLAGTGLRGKKDGPSLEATFSFPNGIAVSHDGKTIYVNDVAVNSGDNSNGVNFNPNTLRVVELIE